MRFEEEFPFLVRELMARMKDYCSVQNLFEEFALEDGFHVWFLQRIRENFTTENLGFLFKVQMMGKIIVGEERMKFRSSRETENESATILITELPPEGLQHERGTSVEDTCLRAGTRK